MFTDAESVAGLGDFVVADINALIAKRLREEHLYHFIRSRDDLLRLERNDDSDTIRLLRHQSLRVLEKTWASVLQTLRSELPRTLDHLFSKLQPEFRIAGDSPSRSRDITPLTPLDASVEVPRLLATAYTPRPMPAQEPEASGADSPVLGNKNRDLFAPDIASVAKTEELSTATEVEPPADKPSEKRPLSPQDLEITSPKKKAKRTPRTETTLYSGYKPIKKNMFLCEVEAQECIFSFSGRLGFYVLRCNQLKCRKGLGQDEGTIFTSHPFKDGLALDHFAKEWHDINSEEEIFRKFAIRVIDAESERNVDKRDNTQTSDDNLSSENLTPRPTAPQGSRAKGKQPERPYNLYSAETPAADASTSASASNINETFKESFYRAGPLLSISESTPLSDEGGEVALLTKGRQPDAE
ncbi:hypothetical protein F5Y12DRAFT_574628 [Xylaria sp. FL1777]|nr:hypothetical protein F5Y12DRAFT_574628 [Xylaria sp. FL1777]